MGRYPGSGPDVLTALVGLVDKSVVLRPQEPAGNEPPRYRLLDTIREFGAERLTGSGQQAAVRARHVAYYLGLAEDFAGHDKDPGQLARFRALRGEHANLRAALGYALDPAVAAEERLEAAACVSGLVSLDIHLGYLHLLAGRPQEAIDRCAQGLRRLDRGEHWARSYLQVITALGLFLRGDSEDAAAAARESLRLKDAIGDITGIAYCLEMLAMLPATPGTRSPGGSRRSPGSSARAWPTPRSPGGCSSRPAPSTRAPPASTPSSASPPGPSSPPRSASSQARAAPAPANDPGRAAGRRCRPGPARFPPARA